MWYFELEDGRILKDRDQNKKVFPAESMGEQRHGDKEGGNEWKEEHYFIFFFKIQVVSFSFCLWGFFGHTTWLTGSQFPDKGLNPGLSCESAKS